MNEMNSLIASVMEKLSQIRDVQQQMALCSGQLGPRTSDNENEMRRALPLCNKTLQMLEFLNSDAEIQTLFLLDELCPWLVNMLVHVLTKLAGSRRFELKIGTLPALRPSSG